LDAATQVPGFEAGATKPLRQVQAGVLLGPLRLQEPWPLQGPLGLSAPQKREHTAVPRCGGEPRRILLQSWRQFLARALQNPMQSGHLQALRSLMSHVSAAPAGLEQGPVRKFQDTSSSRAEDASLRLAAASRSCANQAQAARGEASGEVVVGHVQRQAVPGRGSPG